VQTRDGVISSPTSQLPDPPNVEDDDHDHLEADDNFFMGKDVHLNATNAGPSTNAGTSEQNTKNVTVTTHPQLDGMRIHVRLILYIADT